MSILGLTLDELMEVVRTCDSIEIDECTPPYLQDFIAGRLADDFPQLSSVIRGFTKDEMDVLCERIKDTHALTR